MATATMTAQLGEQTRSFYQRVLLLLAEAKVPFLVGGAYAYARYTGIERHTKDFDLFVRRTDYDRAAKALEKGGYLTELTFPHWLGKAFFGGDFVDLIFGGGNGIAIVDDVWFEKAVPEVVFDTSVLLIPVEEMIWSKAFIMERERYDGADIAHLLRARAESLDWERLLERFGDNWRVLLTHLILFDFVYPDARQSIPSGVIADLLTKVQSEHARPTSKENICRGTILSRGQYLTDVQIWGMEDARLRPRGGMSEAEIAHWTAAIEED